MKLYLYRLAAFLLLISLLVISRQLFAQKTPDVTLEKVAEKCKGLARDKRVVVKVARFNVSTKSAQTNSTFGDAVATMLTSAIQQTNCFRVMEMNRNAGDATGEVTAFSGGNKSTQTGAFNFGLEESKASLKMN